MYLSNLFLKKIKIKINFFPKRSQRVKNYFCYFLWFVFKNNDVIWLVDKRWEMRSRAPIFNGTSHTENSHLWKNG